MCPALGLKFKGARYEGRRRSVTCLPGMFFEPKILPPTHCDDDRPCIAFQVDFFYGNITYIDRVRALVAPRWLAMRRPGGASGQQTKSKSSYKDWSDDNMEGALYELAEQFALNTNTCKRRQLCKSISQVNDGPALLGHAF